MREQRQRAGRSCWKDQPSRSTKCENTIIIKNWFGEETDSSSDNIEEDSDKEWSEVERKKHNQRRKLRAKEKKLLREKTTLQKTACMVGLGPITNDTINFYNKKKNNHEEARREAAKEFLIYQLGFLEEDVDKDVIQGDQAGCQ